MKIYKLDKEEKNLIKSMNRGEWTPVENLEQWKTMLSKIAKDSKVGKEKKKRINIRLNEYDLQLIKAKASSVGLPYQTFIGSELHKIAHK